ncbi:hypothetical protein, partial [Weissella confusa]|uniref:hypothetical protein n=1 Tax=Weissella confusa TaxID=1583 RepID=UPI001A7EC1BF
TGCSWSVLFYFYTQKQKKVPTTNRVSEWSSVPNILEPELKASGGFSYFVCIDALRRTQTTFTTKKDLKQRKL